MPTDSGRHPLSYWLTAACGVWLIGLGIYFVFLRPALLPEDPRFMGATREQVAAALPGLERWLRHVFTVLGGFMAAGGCLTILAASAVHRSRGARALFAFAGVTGVGLMSAVNFSLQSDFRWLLVLPAALWAVAVVSALGRDRDCR